MKIGQFSGPCATPLMARASLADLVGFSARWSATWC
jgi:hypothetical protein